MNPMKPIFSVAPALLAFAWIALSQNPPAATDKCGSLRQSPQITSATMNAAAAAKGKGPAAPEHCEVLGKLNERTGINGQAYAIKFHLRLPTNWNGNFFFEGGGGSNGNLGTAFGNLQGAQPGNALSLGYAVVSQDSGHDNAVNNDPARNGTVTFGFDPQARIDFGYNSYDQVTRTAKALIQTMDASSGAIKQWLYRDPARPVERLAAESGFPLSGREIVIETPLTEEKVRALKVGDIVLINGLIYTGRDEAHHYMMQIGRAHV